MSYLQRRGAMYRFRRYVPPRLRPIIGKHEVVRSLKTKDAAEAQRWGIAVSADVDRLFADAEAALSNPFERAMIVERAKAVRVYTALQQDAEERLRRPRTDDDDGAESFGITQALERLEDDVPTPDALTQRSILEGMLKRRTGESKDDSADNPPLSLLFDRWRAERQPPLKTWEEWTTARKRFERAAGGDISVRSITKSHFRAFKDALLKTPARRRGGAMLSAATIQKNLNALRSVMSWAVAQGYLEVNPATGISHAGVKKSQEQTRRLPYETDDLVKLFSVKKTGADYWLPLLGLYTGARLEELGQLRVGDVKEEDGCPYIHIRGGDGRRVKNRGSERRVPLHPELLRLGFLKYVSEQRGDSVFPELKKDSHGTLTRMWSKRFRHFARSVGLNDPRKTFHSLRHSFKDSCRRAGLGEEIHDALTGHTNGSVGRSYGLGVPMRVLADAVAKVRYAGVKIKRSG